MEEFIIKPKIYFQAQFCNAPVVGKKHNLAQDYPMIFSNMQITSHSQYKVQQIDYFYVFDQLLDYKNHNYSFVDIFIRLNGWYF